MIVQASEVNIIVTFSSEKGYVTIILIKISNFILPCITLSISIHLDFPHKNIFYLYFYEGMNKREGLITILGIFVAGLDDYRNRIIILIK